MGGKSSSSSSSNQTTNQNTTQTQGDTTINDFSNFFGSSVLNTGSYSTSSTKSATPQNYSTPYMNSSQGATQRNDASATGAQLSTLPGLTGGVAGGATGSVMDSLGSLAGGVLGGLGSSTNASYDDSYNTSYTPSGNYGSSGLYYGNSGNSSGMLPIMILGAVGIGAYFILKGK